MQSRWGFFFLLLQFCYALKLQTAMCHCLSPPEINPNPRHKAASLPIHPWQRNTGSQAGFSNRKRFHCKVGQRMWLLPAKEGPMGASVLTMDALLLVVLKGKSARDQRPVMLRWSRCVLCNKPDWFVWVCCCDRHQRSASNEAEDSAVSQGAIYITTT